MIRMHFLKNILIHFTIFVYIMSRKRLNLMNHIGYKYFLIVIRFIVDLYNITVFTSTLISMNIISKILFNVNYQIILMIVRI